MTIPVELGQFLGLAFLVGLSFVAGISWGRKNPDKVEKLNQEIKELKAKLDK